MVTPSTPSHTLSTRRKHVAGAVSKLVPTKRMLVYFRVVVGTVCKSSAHAYKIEPWGYFIPASWCTNSNQLNFKQHVVDTKFCPQNRTFFKKEGLFHCHCNMYLQHVSTVARLQLQIINYLLIDIKTAATRLLGVIKIRSASGNSSVCIYSIIYQDYIQVTRVFALEKSSLPRII